MDCAGGRRHLRSFPARRSSDLWSRNWWSCNGDGAVDARVFSQCATGGGSFHSVAHCENTRASTAPSPRSEEHTSELQSHVNLVCRLLLEKKKKLASAYAGQTSA